MPTTNWILEAAEDRYLEATDRPMHAGAPLVRQVTLPCPFCDRRFVSEDASEAGLSVARHVAREHPLLRPVLIIGDRILATTAVITRRPSQTDVVIENATTIKVAVDGGPDHSVSAEEAARIVGARPKQMLHLHLANERAQDATATAIEYRIRVDVADESELDRVDEAFIQHLARDDVDRDDVVRFSNETDGVANHYRDGLASYVLGVLAKDDTSVSDDPGILERALALFGRAATHLADAGDRRVPAAVAACACLNLNDFSHVVAQTGVPSVDAASVFLRGLAMGWSDLEWPTRPAGQASDVGCPVDETTFAFLELLFSLAEPAATERAADALERVEHGTLTSPDRSKFAAVLGEWANARGLDDTARRCATILLNDPIFEGAATRWKTT